MNPMTYYILSNPILIQTSEAKPVVRVMTKATSQSEIVVLLAKGVQAVESTLKRLGV